MARPLRVQFPGAFYHVIKHLSRYIHLNPVRATLVASVIDYPWSSYRASIA